MLALQQEVNDKTFPYMDISSGPSEVIADGLDPQATP
jgi:hypothetical protein